MPSRRALLRTLSIGPVATAGCAGLTDRLDGSDGAPTRSVGEQYETDDGRTVRVSHPVVHPSVTTVEAVSYHRYERVSDAGDDQFLSVLVTTTGFEPGPGGRTNSDEPIDLPLAVEADGSRHRQIVPVRADVNPDLDRVAIRVPVADVPAATSSGNVTTARSQGGDCRTPCSGTSTRGPGSRWNSSPSRSAWRPARRSRPRSTSRTSATGRGVSWPRSARNAGRSASRSPVSLSTLARRTLQESITASGDGDWPIRVVLVWGAGRHERTVTVADDDG